MKPVIALPGMLFSAAVGLIAGYFSGFEDHAANSSAIDAAYSAQVAIALRNGDMSTAAMLVETKLDSQVMAYMGTNSGVRPLQFLTADVERDMLRVAAKYREEYPSSNADKLVQLRLKQFIAERK